MIELKLTGETAVELGAAITLPPMATTTAQRGRTARKRSRNADFRVRLEFMEGMGCFD